MFQVNVNVGNIHCIKNYYKTDLYDIQRKYEPMAMFLFMNVVSIVPIALHTQRADLQSSVNIFFTPKTFIKSNILQIKVIWSLKIQP